MGIDYGMGTTNIDKKTGIRYGVISQHEVLQAWCDSSEPEYAKPKVDDYQCPTCGSIAEDCDDDIDWGDMIECTNKECDDFGDNFEVEFPDSSEPLCHYVDEDGIQASCGDSGDIFVTRSPYYAFCGHCSPCAPGAGYLTSDGDVNAYCFGHDWFESGKAPYRVYEVKTNLRVLPSGKLVLNHPNVV